MGGTQPVKRLSWLSQSTRRPQPNHTIGGGLLLRETWVGIGARSWQNLLEGFSKVLQEDAF
jgi:hypothetical protein